MYEIINRNKKREFIFKNRKIIRFLLGKIRIKMDGTGF